MKSVIISIRMLAVMILLTGVIYPAFITITGQLFFNFKANGSMIKIENKMVGSTLIGQKFTDDKYFRGRPSAGDYETVPSGASNLSQTSAKLFENYQSQKKAFGNKNDIPIELLFSSGSGLDPHITPEAAYFQVERVAKARNFTEEQIESLEELIKRYTENRTFLLLGEKRINVLLLNIALDRMSE